MNMRIAMFQRILNVTVTTTFIKHKRYQMTDISKLEQRIKNLEYYTSLNQLESKTLISLFRFQWSE